MSYSSSDDDDDDGGEEDVTRSVGLSYFILFLVLYAKGEKIREVNNFFDAMERRLLQIELHVLIRLE